MSETLYSVYLDRDLVAREMRFEFALMMVKALFETYYQEANTVGLKVQMVAYPAKYEPGKENADGN